MRIGCTLLVMLAACGHGSFVPDAPDDVFVEALPITGSCAPTFGTSVALRPITQLPGAITLVTAPPGDARLFVVTLTGTIWIIENGQLLPDPFLDIRQLPATTPPFTGGGGEQGLLGLAFHPQFATNHTLFVNYTGTDTDPTFPLRDVTVRLGLDATDPNKADPATAAVLLSIPDFASNHNGGMLEFGPDGYLYVGDGDGGGGGDPMLTAQNTRSLLGKISRLDVDRRDPDKEYAIPPTNPFADGIAGLPEIYILGVRNPWRFSFDAASGDLWIGDVGQGLYEEVDVLHPSEQAGANLGWSRFEGNHCYNGPCDDTTGLTFPKDERAHADGWCAVIGGAVYRGGCYPDIVGEYFYSDYCSGGLSRARLHDDGTLEVVDTNGLVLDPTSMHAVANGEIYLSDINGNVYHVEAGP